MVSKTVDFSKLKRVLVVKLRHHGDVLLSSPVFSTLKEQYPHLQVDALVYEDTKDMLVGHPGVDNVWTIDRNWKKLGFKQQLKFEGLLLGQLRQQGYQLLIHLTEHWRGAILANLLGAQYRVVAGYNRRQGIIWKYSFTHHYPVMALRRHTVEKHLDALRHLGVMPTETSRRLTIVAGEEAEAAVFEKLASASVQLGQYIHIHPTSRWLFKSWQENKVAELINRLMQQGHQVVVSAAPDKAELQMVERILQQVSDQPYNLSGQLTLKELVALIDHARLFIGVDSVPMHIAAATQTASVVLFGPSSELLWAPWQAEHRLIASDHSCRPCDLAGCADGGKSECLMSIGVDEVFDSVNQLLL